MRQPTLLVALAIALTAPVLAGCVGDKDEKAPDDGGVTVTGEGPEPTKAPVNLNDRTDPKAHFHHYWGDPPLDEVTVFDGDVTLEGPNLEHFNKGTLYWAEFGLEDDGDDVSRTDDFSISSAGKADTVFVGTKEVRVEVTFELDGVSAVYLQWKPANTNRFKPESGGQAFFAGQTSPHTIPLTEVGQSDPAHQSAVSRWRFRIWVVSENAGALGSSDVPPLPPILPPNSIVHLKMTAVNGGESFLDPPHPNFWTEGDEISLGATGTVTLAEPAVFTPVLRERNPALTDISIPPGNIVPLGTKEVIVRLKATTTFPPAPPPGFSLAIAYHGADRDVYEFPDPVPGTPDGDWLVWTIPTASEENPEEEVKVDPPYESNSMWRFEIVPIVNDGADSADDPNGNPVNVQRYVGVWQGSYEMQFEAVKLPGFVLV